MPSLIVQKYGGTSVASPQKIRQVAARIAEAFHRGDQLVVVVSAMGHTTDELIDLAHQVSQSPSSREMDMLLTTGERVSMALLAMALQDLQVPSLSLTGSQSGIITSSQHRRARIKKILGNRIQSSLQSGKVVIVAGFQGVSEEKEITTLGRGGSDTSAVALAAVLRAERCEIYTDVNGVYSADPRVVPGARWLKALDHRHMVELAARGAGVLHLRSVELAARFQVPLVVLNSGDAHPGTFIGKEAEIMSLNSTNGMEEMNIVGVTAAKDLARVSVTLRRPGAASAVWFEASKKQLTLMTPRWEGLQIEFFASREAQAEWKTLLQTLCEQDYVKSFEWLDEWIPVSIVGEKLAQDGTALFEVLDLMSEHQISVREASASSLAITLAIQLKNGDDAVRLIHQRWVEKAPSPPSPSEAKVGR